MGIVDAASATESDVVIAYCLVVFESGAITFVTIADTK
jgi:hypothetical protein